MSLSHTSRAAASSRLIDPDFADLDLDDDSVHVDPDSLEDRVTDLDFSNTSSRGFDDNEWSEYLHTDDEF